MTIVLPPVPDTSIHGDGCTFTYYHHEILLSRNAYGLSYFCLAIAYRNQKIIVDVYVLRDDIWAIYSSAAVSQGPEIKLYKPTLLAGGKLYNLIFGRSNPYKLLLLDLESSCLSLVNLPDEEVEAWNVKLSLAHDSELHLMHVDVDTSQLRIWLHKMDSTGATIWSLVNTVCLREICANHMIPTRVFEDFGDSILTLHAAVGAGSEFVFIEIESVLYLFDIKHKAAKKVYETTRQDERLCSVIPFMMPWPPNFPLMKELFI
ncbi:hypothetical protein CFC21_105199 [Triticum aestivum]|uniref:F-box protein AT5G49610-like beta-propeller domain-containing protein n=2 Tax=Triticum aestivum TaxID=4565 RepID=A0A9R1MC25_WHEAT|nr:hypothetical protein CFC21_105199 [Triticum aestivum]